MDIHQKEKEFDAKLLLKYLYSIYPYFGVGSIFYADKKFMPTSSISKAYSLLLSSIGVYYVIYRIRTDPKSKDANNQDNLMIAIVMKLFLISNSCVAISSWIKNAFFTTKKSMKFVDNLEYIENNLSDVVATKRIKFKIIAIHAIIMMFFVLQFVFDPLQRERNLQYYWFSIMLITTDVILARFLCEMIVMRVFVRIWRELLTKVVAEQNKNDIFEVQSEMDHKNKFDLEIMMRTFDMIVENIFISKFIVAWPLVFSLLCSFIYCVFILSTMFMSANLEYHEIISNLLWCAHYICYVMGPICICQFVEDDLNDIKYEVLKIYINDKIEQKTNNFLKLKQTVVKREINYFTGNLFIVNYTLLFAILAALATYMIIVMQMS